MKKLGLLVSLLLCTVAMWAQNDVHVRFGAMAGFNMSKWGGDYGDLYGSKFQMGGNFGGVCEIQINQTWSIQPEIMFSMEGTKTDGNHMAFCKDAPSGEDPIEFDVPKKVQADFIKVPIYVLYSFHNIGPGRLSPGIGIYCAWAFSGKSDVSSEFEEDGTFSDGSFFRTVNNAIKERYKDCPQDFTEEDLKNMDLWDKSVPRRFDYGIGVKCMYELEKYAPGVYGSLGITEGLAGSFNMNLMFSLGYKFKYNKMLRTKYNEGMLKYNPY